MTIHYSEDMATVYHGNCREVMQELPSMSVQSIITDPPYDLTARRNGASGFMGKHWDGTGIAFDAAMWRECLRVLAPGGHLISFGGTRTWHRLAVAIEDAGFEVRDSIAWLHGSGMPKSMNVAKAIEAYQTTGKSNSRSLRATEQAGDGSSYRLVGTNNGILGKRRIYDRKEYAPGTDEARSWQGWGTALRPAFEPIVVARKVLEGTVAENVLQYSVGALNIDATRAGADGKWPPNVAVGNADVDSPVQYPTFTFYSKAGKTERPLVDGVKHPTVKPVDLMRWLVRLVTPPGGTVLEPFAGSGTTVDACVRERRKCIAIEREAEYLPLIVSRLEGVATSAEIDFGDPA